MQFNAATTTSDMKEVLTLKQVEEMIRLCRTPAKAMFISPSDFRGLKGEQFLIDIRECHAVPPGTGYMVDRALLDPSIMWSKNATFK